MTRVKQLTSQFTSQVIDPSVARIWGDFYPPGHKTYIRENEEIYGRIEISHRNPVGNTDWEYLFFENTDVFRPAAIHFNTHGRYTNHPYKSISYINFWKEEQRRCKEGYSVGGLWIPGEYYFYLNYCRIKRTRKEGGEILEFPRFLSMDYYYFLELDKNKNNPDLTLRKNMVLTKARRKGFSFKNAGLCVHMYSFYPESTTIICAEFGKKARNTFEMCLDMIDFLNEHTEFRSPYYKRTVSDNSCEIASGAKVKSQGRTYIKGRKSKIIAIPLNNKPDAAAGFGASLIIIDEAGMCPQLDKVIKFTDPVLMDGKKRKGIMIIFGTGGDMEGATKKFSEVFNNPKGYNCADYHNIYEKEEKPEDVRCGFFVDEMWYRDGVKFKINGQTWEGLDENGNAYRHIAEMDLNVERERLRKHSRSSYNVYLTQRCKTPTEAFLVTEGAVFPTDEIYAQLSRVKQENSIFPVYRKGKLIENNGQVRFVPDMEGTMHPVNNYPLTDAQKKSHAARKGCILQYHAPVTIGGEIPEDAYIIGHDPWGIDAKLIKVDSDTSMGATYVIRTRKYFKEMGYASTVVAAYVGRTDTMDEYNENLLKLSKYYNAKVMFENDRGDVVPFFEKRKALDRLATPAFHIIHEHTPNSRILTRKYGFSSSNIKFKQIAIQYLIEWLMEPTMDGSSRNIDHLYDIGLLEEMLAFNFEHGNYDRVMAMVGAVLHLENEQVLIEAGAHRKNNTIEFLKTLRYKNDSRRKRTTR